MAISSIMLRPGIRADITTAMNEGGYSSGNLIRWRQGLPEKIGGWEKYWPFAVGSKVRAMHAWRDLNAIDHLAVGAEARLGVITAGDFTTITPQTLDSDFTPDFTTTSGSATVAIDDPNVSNPTTDDSVYFATPVSVGGVVLAGLYPISLVTGTTTYEVTATSLATSSVANGGAVAVFDTTDGSAVVDVTLADHGLSVGSVFTVTIDVSVGGLTLAGTFAVLTVASADEFSITAASSATSTDTQSMNGGDARITYYINLGPPAAGAGYGLGTYGTGGYGTGVLASAQTGDTITATSWTLDNWGKTLLACPDGGAIYSWDPDGGFQTAAALSTSDAPLFNTGMFIAQPAQILVCYGSTTSVILGRLGLHHDPLLVRWSDQDDYSNFAIDTTNQVGSVRIPRGSEIVSGMQGPSQALLWTDIAVWSMQYVGQPLVFGFQEMATGCGLVGKFARCTLAGVVYWQSFRNFYLISGSGVQMLPCSVWDEVFQDLDSAAQSKCVAWANSMFNEVWFFYPSLRDGTGENTRFVKYNPVEQAWDYGVLGRSAAIDQSVLGEPIAATTGGIIYQHETSMDADGSAISSWIESGDFMISDGTYCAFTDHLRPDAKFMSTGATTGATLKFTLTVTNDITGVVQTIGPLSFTSATQYLTYRARGHRMRVRISSDDLGTWWRGGRSRYRGAPDGKQ